MAADPGHDVDVPLTSEEWDDVVRRLTVLGYVLVPADQVLRGRGVGAEDLVQQTILRLVDPASKVKWRREFGEPTVSGIVGFLGQASKRNGSIQLRSGFPYPQFIGVAISCASSTSAVSPSHSSTRLARAAGRATNRSAAYSRIDRAKAGRVSP